MKRSLLIMILILPQLCFAWNWSDLWFTPNQQGAKLLHQGKVKQAAKQFTNPLWKGVANYRAGQYQQALKDFSKTNTPIANYNRGNALAYLGQYQQAIAAYDKALKQNPKLKDADYNKNLLEQLLQQKPKKSNRQNNQGGRGQKNQKNQQAQNQSQQNNQQDNSKSSQQSQSSQQPQNQPQQSQENSQQNQRKQQAQVKSQPESQNKQDQQQASKQQNNQTSQNQQPQSQMQTPQQKQALQQWLRQIPDDPGGLLRQKFLRDHMQIEAEKAKQDYIQNH